MNRFFKYISSSLLVIFIIIGVTGCTCAKDSTDNVIPINLQNAKNIGSIFLTLSYNPRVIEISEVNSGKLTESSMLEFNLDQPGKVVIGIINSQGITGDGDIALLGFKVLDRTGTSVLSLASVKLYEATNLVDVLYTLTHGNFASNDYNIKPPIVSCSE